MYGNALLADEEKIDTGTETGTDEEETTHLSHLSQKTSFQKNYG